jgi:nucleoid-associated protein YgaU
MSTDPNTDPVQAMLAQTSLQRSLFSPTSRYYGLATATLSSDGETVIYVRRRFVPQPERFQTIQQYTVKQGDRLDNVAAAYLGDPALFWRICDANRAMRPWTVTATPGATLRVTMPDGITGSAL